MAKANEFFEGIRSSLEEGLTLLKSGQPLPRRRVIVPDPPEAMTPRDVVALRTSLGMTQAVFSRYLNVSIQAIRAWEQGRNAIPGLALRLLQLVRIHPEIVERGPDVLPGPRERSRHRHLQANPGRHPRQSLRKIAAGS